MTRFIALVALIAVAAGGGYLILGSGKEAPSAGEASRGPRAIPVEMQVVETGPFVVQETAVGSLASDEAVIIRSEIAGRVETIHFEEGQAVSAGDPLISIDDDIFRAEYDQARARLRLSEANYERAVNLEKQGAGTQRALDEAQSKLQEDRATVALAKARLDRTEIVAPFGGVIGIREVSPGDYITAGQTIVNLEAIDPIKVAFRAPEVMLSILKTGQAITVEVDAFPGETFSGEVYAINPRIESAGRSVELRARIDNPDGRLRPGLFARVNVIFERRENAILIPERTLVPISGKQYVFVVDNGTATLREVVIGGRQGSEVEITHGLSAGETVITGGQLKVRDGTPVSDAAAMGPTS